MQVLSSIHSLLSRPDHVRQHYHCLPYQQQGGTTSAALCAKMIILWNWCISSLSSGETECTQTHSADTLQSTTNANFTIWCYRTTSCDAGPQSETWSPLRQTTSVPCTVPGKPTATTLRVMLSWADQLHYTSHLISPSYGSCLNCCIRFDETGQRSFRLAPSGLNSSGFSISAAYPPPPISILNFPNPLTQYNGWIKPPNPHTLHIRA